MAKKAGKRMRQLLAVTMTAAMAVQAFPIAQVGAVYEEEQAHQEALRNELAASADMYPEGAFAFYESSSEVSEHGGEHAIKVVRRGDTSAEATVEVKAIEATAKYGEDYEVYYIDGLTRVDAAEKSESDAEPAAEEEAFAELPEDVSPLRTAYAEQTGQQPVNTNWRGEYEDYVTRTAIESAKKEVINTVEGQSLTLSFAPGEFEKTIYLKPLNDALSEDDEMAALLLGNASVGEITDESQHSIKILNDEPDEKIVYAMERSEIVVPEGAEYAEIKVKRTSGLNYFAGAVYHTVAGTAKPEVNYTPANDEHISFSTGETEQYIRIPLLEKAEPGSYFTVSLNTDAVNVEEGKDTVKVWLGEKPGSNFDPTMPTSSASRSWRAVLLMRLSLQQQKHSRTSLTSVRIRLLLQQIQKPSMVLCMIK